jgi:hypothetical protein
MCINLIREKNHVPIKKKENIKQGIKKLKIKIKSIP